jgi:hypothetical protein
MSILDPRRLDGIIGSYTLTRDEWQRMRAEYGIASEDPPVVHVARRGFSQFAFEAVTFQTHPRNRTRRTSASAAKSVALADELRATPGLIVDEVDQQIVSLLALGSSRAVIATIVGIGQATIKKRIVVMQERRDGKA